MTGTTPTGAAPAGAAPTDTTPASETPAVAPVVAPTEYRQNNRCHTCRKGIVWPGMCYSCATGRPRVILRPDERRSLLNLPSDGPDILSVEQPT